MVKGNQLGKHDIGYHIHHAAEIDKQGLPLVGHGISSEGAPPFFHKEPIKIIGVKGKPLPIVPDTGFDVLHIALPIGPVIQKEMISADREQGREVSH